jgi:hypothetical protein
MKQKDNNNSRQKAGNEKTDITDTMLYPAAEDIYNRSKNEVDIDPEDTSTVKQLDETYNEAIIKNKDGNEDIFERDLDVPGSELDDEQEKIGSEDEENNYYSLGLDNHNDLEENNE